MAKFKQQDAAKSTTQKEVERSTVASQRTFRDETLTSEEVSSSPVKSSDRCRQTVLTRGMSGCFCMVRFTTGALSVPEPHRES